MTDIPVDKKGKLTNTINDMAKEKTKDIKYGVGLDVGTGFLVSSRFKGTDISYLSIRDAFFRVDKSVFNSKMFDKNKMRYIETNDEVYVVGEDAITFARIKNQSADRPLSKGIINPTEKASAPVLREMFRYIIQGHIARDNEKLVFSIPGPQVGNPDFDTMYHSMSLTSLLKQFGCDPEPINEGFAVSVAMTGVNNTTALSFSFGAGLVNCCLSYKGINLFEFSINKSGDFIDWQAAQAVGESTAHVSYIKENKLDLSKNEYDVSHEERALIFSYRYIVQNTLAEVKKAFIAQDSVRVIEDIPIFISGGTSMPNGFLDLFKQELKAVKLPFKVSDIFQAPNPLKTVAKGCLIYANTLV
jgi:hypothetical protein